MTAPSFAAVKAAARGHWPAILPALGIPAEALVNRHGPCPGCAGRDRFRFDDREGNGTWICGGGGERRAGDGFALLGHCLGMTPAAALAAVTKYLGLHGDATPEDRQEAHRRRDAAAQADIEAALLDELYVLVSIVQARVTDRTIALDRNFRAARPEWRPLPDGEWEREREAAGRICNGLEALYGR